MTSEIPSHNLEELLNASIALIKNPKLTTEDLMTYIKGPDYPTGGIIINKNDLVSLYETGTGKVTIRSKLHTEEGTYGKTNIIIDEIPYSQSGRKSALIQEIIEGVKNRTLDEISDIRDESNKEEIRIVLEVKKGIDIDNFLNKLYAKTKLQDSISYNFLLLHNGQPEVINLKEYLKIYLDFQKELILNEAKLNLKQANSSLEILDGLLLALDNIDTIIATIRNSKNSTIAKNCLMTGDISKIEFKLAKDKKIASKFAFSESQAKAILELRLQRLCGLEILTLEKEKKDLLRKIKKLEKILTSKAELNKVLNEQLEDLKKYSGKRKTKITNTKVEHYTEKVVVSDVTIAIDRFLYVKAIDGAIETTNMKYSLKGKTNEKLCIFTDKGNLYQIKINSLPKGKLKDKGSPLDVVCGFKEKNENILLIGTDSNFENRNIVFLLRSGYLKQVPFKEYNSNYKCIVATKLYDSELIGIQSFKPTDKLKFKTNKRNIEISLKEFGVHSKSNKGNKCISFRKDEEISEII